MELRRRTIQLSRRLYAIVAVGTLMMTMAVFAPTGAEADAGTFYNGCLRAYNNSNKEQGYFFTSSTGSNGCETVRAAIRDSYRSGLTPRLRSTRPSTSGFCGAYQVSGRTETDGYVSRTVYRDSYYEPCSYNSAQNATGAGSIGANYELWIFFGD